MYISIIMGFLFLNLLFAASFYFGVGKNEVIKEGIVVYVDKKGSVVSIEGENGIIEACISEKYPIGTGLKIECNDEINTYSVKNSGDFKNVGVGFFICFLMDLFYVVMGHWGDITVNLGTFILLLLSSFFVVISTTMRYVLDDFANENVIKVDAIFMHATELDDDENYVSPEFRYYDNGEEKFIDQLEYRSISELDLLKKMSSKLVYNKESHKIMSEFEVNAFKKIHEISAIISSVLFICILIC